VSSFGVELQLISDDQAEEAAENERLRKKLEEMEERLAKQTNGDPQPTAKQDISQSTEKSASAKDSASPAAPATDVQ
jgi:cell division septum initiation protein DivIVA